MTHAHSTQEARSIIKVLCVDDHPDICKLLEMAITGEPDMQLTAVLDRVDKVLDELARDQADVALIDLSMPGQDPLKVIKEIGDRYPDTRSVAFSAHDDPASVARARSAGAAGYISKMKDLTVVMNGIRRVVNGETVEEVG